MELRAISVAGLEVRYSGDESGTNSESVRQFVEERKSENVPYLDLGECEDQITCVIGLTTWMNWSWE